MCHKSRPYSESTVKGSYVDIKMIQRPLIKNTMLFSFAFKNVYSKTPVIIGSYETRKRKFYYSINFNKCNVTLK